MYTQYTPYERKEREKTYIFLIVGSSVNRLVGAFSMFSRRAVNCQHAANILMYSPLYPISLIENRHNQQYSNPKLRASHSLSQYIFIYISTCFSKHIIINFNLFPTKSESEMVLFKGYRSYNESSPNKVL